MSEPQRRRAALKDALAGDLTRWSGLPEGCTAGDFAAVSQDEVAAGTGRLAGVPVPFRDYDGFPGPLRVFFDDVGHAFLLWADWPPGGGDGAAAIAELGPAEAILTDGPSRWSSTVQHVWSQRGVAAYVSFDGSVRGLALFTPITLEEYRANYGGNEGPSYRPYRTLT